MGEPEHTRKITRNIQWKLNLAELIMQVNELPEETCRLIIKSYYTKMHEGAAAEGFQNISVDEAIKHYGGDSVEALKRYLKCWFLLNIPLEGGSLGPSPADAPPIVQRVWKNLEKLLLYPLDDEARIASEVHKRTEALEASVQEYKMRLAGSLKAVENLPANKKDFAEKLQEAYTKVERAAKDLEDLTKEYEIEKSARGQAEKRIEGYDKQIAGLKAGAEKTIKEEKDKRRASEETVRKKEEVIKDLNEIVKTTKEANEDLANKVGSLEGEVAKEKADKELYQNQSVKARSDYDDKERELVQEREISKTERGKADSAKAKADKLEKKLNNINLKWGIRAGIGAALLAAGIYFFRPPVQAAPVENVPQEIINYSKDIITVKFGSAIYEMSADRFSEIYQNIQKDQQKSGKQFTPADRKQYFEKKVESTRQIK